MPIHRHLVFALSVISQLGWPADTVVAGFHRPRHPFPLPADAATAGRPDSSVSVYETGPADRLVLRVAGRWWRLGTSPGRLALTSCRRRRRGRRRVGRTVLDSVLNLQSPRTPPLTRCVCVCAAGGCMSTASARGGESEVVASPAPPVRVHCPLSTVHLRVRCPIRGSRWLCTPTCHPCAACILFL